MKQFLFLITALVLLVDCRVLPRLAKMAKTKSLVEVTPAELTADTHEEAPSDDMDADVESGTDHPESHDDIADPTQSPDDHGDGSHSMLEWNIWTHGAGKGKVHERISEKAVAGIDHAIIVANNIKDGVRYNDMPSENEKEPVGIITFGSVFSKNRGWDVADDLITANHFGCLQHWHAMCPSGMGETKIRFTNQDTKDLIYNQFQDWWGKASAAAAGASKGDASFYLGHMFHTIQDSYSRGHCSRVVGDASTTITFERIVIDCGRVGLFQGYEGQEKKPHSKADRFPKHQIEEKQALAARLYRCSQYYSHLLAENLVACADAPTTRCDFKTYVVTPILNKVFALSDNTKDLVCGGARPEWKMTDAVEDRTYGTYSVFATPTEGTMYSALTANICPDLYAHQHGTGITRYDHAQTIYTHQPTHTQMDDLKTHW